MKIHIINGKRYVFPKDLENENGIKYVTIKQWKNRKIMQENIDYIKIDYPSNFMMNIDSEFIKKRITNNKKSK